MRFLSLQLIAFGPFTNVSVDLSGGRHGLHIVFGRNESGKSSALRALRQLLYGIPANSTDNFVHPYANMRVGATIESADGRRLEVVRRKGNKNTLRDADDGPVDENVLSGLLSGIDQRQFEVMFGLDHDTLVRGGHDLISGGSDLGQILFSAGASIAGVQSVLSALEEEAKSLFLPAGKVPRINETVRNLNDFRSQLKSKQLSASEFTKHEQALHDALKLKDCYETDLFARQAELRRLERLRDARPIVVQRALCLQALQQLGDAVSLPADFAERVRDLLNRRQNATSGAELAAQAIDTIEKQIADIRVPDALLKHAESIESLYKELGGHLKAAQDRIKLETQLRDCEAEAFNILKSLGKAPALDQCDHLRMTTQQRALLNDLMLKAEAVQAASRTAQQQRIKLEQELSLKRQEFSQLPPQRDVAPLQAELRRLQKLGQIEQQLDALSEEIEKLNARIEIGKSKLALSGRQTSEIGRMAVPLPETIERFRDDIERCERELEEFDARLKESEQALEKVQQEIDRLELEMDVPTEAALLETRARRDRGWQMIKGWWIDGQCDAEAISAFTGEPPTKQSLADNYEHSVAGSDETGDRLRREAERVGQKASLLAQRAEIERQIADLRACRTRSVAAGEDLGRQWAALWSALGVEAATPREMLKWRNWFEKLTELVLEVGDKRTTQARVAEQVEQAKSAVLAALESAGEKAPGSPVKLETLLERADEVVQAAGEVEKTRQVLAGEVKRLTEELRRNREEEERATAEHDRWSESWKHAVAALGLPDSATTVEARAVVEQLDSLFSKLSLRASLKQRIAGIDRDSEAYEQRVRELVHAAAPDTSLSDLNLAVEDLKSRLKMCVDLKARQQALVQRLAEQRQILEEQRESLTAAGDALAVMCAEARCQMPEELLPIARKSQEVQALRQRVSEMDHQLAPLAAGLDLDAFMAAVQSADADTLEQDVQRLSEKIRELHEQLQTVNQTIGSARSELDRMNGGADAAVVAEQMEGLLARLRDDSEQYARLKIAEWLLRRAVDRYREKNQNPVLRRASEIFARLTGGSFAELKPEVDERDRAVLLGVRGDSREEVSLEGMSEGTRDQLYLALRLASVEHILKRQEPIPFIVDDVLVNFDDQRAVAALMALAELSRATQVIMFTHHAHIVELARGSLPASDLFVHELEPRSAAIPRAVAVG
ncbi:MAG TPA: AAA family ATPase [Candidatus Obscuribacterales bacterium]